MDELLYEIINLNDNYGGGRKFHKKIRRILSKFSSLEILFDVFESNLKKNDFLNKNWKSYEIPYLDIFENDKIKLSYHFHIPSNNIQDKYASYLIHHHGSALMSSCIIEGRGYYTIEYHKEINQNYEGNYNLKIQNQFLHKLNNVNFVDSYTPHTIFDVNTPMISVVIWTYDTAKLNRPRECYYFDRNVYKSISEINFLHRIENNPEFEENSIIYPQLICAMIQKLGYDNNIFMESVLNNIDVNNHLYGLLKMIVNQNDIMIPTKKNYLNTLGYKIEKDQILKYHKQN